MLTARGWSLLMFICVLIAAALLDRAIFSLFDLRGLGRYPNVTLGLLGLTLGGWFAWEWLLFAVRARLVVRRLRVERELRDARGPIDVLWARRGFEVRTVLRLPPGLRLAYVKICERLPAGVEHSGGSLVYEGPVDAEQPPVLSYRLRCQALGNVRFEGVRVELADIQGFFHQAIFVAGVAVHRVLPPLADSEGQAATVKRHNLLPPPGVHRLRRPGSGSELLDLRDYLPGDPPKTIAWKASARRDRLMTKEFESEVPVRCTLFVDTSHGVRLSQTPGQNALARLVEIAATVAQAATGDRDLTGLCLFDEKTTTHVRPARGARHLAQLINLLADAAALAPATPAASIHDLLPLAHGFAREVYPDLMRSDLNYTPAWLPWLWPQAAYTVRQPVLADRAFAWLPVLVVPALLGFAGLISLGLAAVILTILTFATRYRFEMGVPEVAVFSGLMGLSLLLGLVQLPVWFFARRRRLYRWRKELAALLSVRHGLAPGGLALLMEDEERFVLEMQHFLAEHHVPYPLPLRDDQGQPVFASAEKVAVLARALLRAVKRGHDNELYVLLVDLLDVADKLEPLLRAMKVTVARHHRVLVICPEPTALPGVPSPGFQELRRTFARLGVPVIGAHNSAPARLVLERLDRLRSLGRSQGLRRGPPR